MSAPRAPSSLSNPAPAVDPADTDAISTIYHHLSHLRQAHSADNVPPLLDIELLVALADALLNAPSDTVRRSQLWTQLLHNVDAALTRALDRSRPLVSPDASDRCVLIPRDIKGWIENVVPIHVELIKNILVEGRGKDAVLELLPLYQQLKNVKNVSPEDHANLYNLVLALDSVLKSEAQELPGDNSVIPPEENLKRLFGLTSNGELQHLCEASGIFDYSTDISEDMSQDDSDNRFILRGVYEAPPAPAAVPVQPSGTSAATASACLPVSRAPVPVAPGDGSADMSLVSDRTRSYMDDSNTSSESTPSAGTPAHSASYEGSMDMSIVPRSPTTRVGELDLSLDPTPPATTAPPSPGLRERTNMPMPPPSPRGRAATAKEDVNPHTPPTSGRVSPASRTGSRSGSGTRAARPSRGAVQPLMQSTPAGAGAHHSQRVPTFGRTASHASAGSDASWDYHGLSPQQPAMEKMLAKEREEREREVKMWQGLIEKEKEERATDAKSHKELRQTDIDNLKVLLQEKDERLREKDDQRVSEVNKLEALLKAESDRRESEVSRLEALLKAESDRRESEVSRLEAFLKAESGRREAEASRLDDRREAEASRLDDRREAEVGLYKGMIAMLTAQCEELKKKVEEASTGKPF